MSSVQLWVQIIFLIFDPAIVTAILFFQAVNNTLFSVKLIDSYKHRKRKRVSARVPLREDSRRMLVHEQEPEKELQVKVEKKQIIYYRS